MASVDGTKCIDDLRVIRGGPWYYELGDLRSHNRNGNTQVVRANDLGFRLAQDPK